MAERPVPASLESPRTSKNNPPSNRHTPRSPFAAPLGQLANLGATLGGDGTTVADKSEAGKAVTERNGRQSRRRHEAGGEVDGNVYHEMYHWIQVEAGQTMIDIEHELIVDQYGVPEYLFTAHLEKELKDEQDVLSLPWAILSVVLFAVMCLKHMEVEQKHSLYFANIFDIKDNANFADTLGGNFGGKDYTDVNSYTDFWSWLNRGFMPLVNPVDIPTSEGSDLDLGQYTASQQARYLYGTKMAPIKISQEEVETAECTNQAVADAFGLECTEAVHTNMYLRPTTSQLSEALLEPSKVVWLNGWNATTHDLVKDLEASGWLNKRTNRIKVSMLTYHPGLDLIGLITIDFLFARSGHIWKQAQTAFMQSVAYTGILSFLVDFLFYVQLLWVLGQEVKELKSGLLSYEGCWKGFKNYVGIWNVIDWLYIICGLAYFTIWMVRISLVKRIEEDFLALSPEAFSCTSDTCNDYFQEAFQRAETAGVFMNALKLMAGLTPLIIMGRLFKAFSAQPRLALVTDTLRVASSALAHYLIVFVSILITFSVMGVAFFGREVEAFATLDRALPSTFRLLMGDLDFERLQIVGRGYTFIFFMAFMLLMVLVMMSMLIAIIMDVYVDVKAANRKSEAIWNSIADVIRRGLANIRKARISLNKIRPSFNIISNVLLMPRDIKERVPSVGDDQIRRLLLGALERYQFEHNLEVPLDDVRSFLDMATFELLQVEDDLMQEEQKGVFNSMAAQATALPPPVDCDAIATQWDLSDLLDIAASKLDLKQQNFDWVSAGPSLRRLIDSAQHILADMQDSAAV